jgi:hypothetical protein
MRGEEIEAPGQVVLLALEMDQSSNVIPGFAVGRFFETPAIDGWHSSPTACCPVVDQLQGLRLAKGQWCIGCLFS